jgi:hypothetical protein
MQVLLFSVVPDRVFREVAIQTLDSLKAVVIPDLNDRLECDRVDKHLVTIPITLMAFRIENGCDLLIAPDADGKTGRNRGERIRRQSKCHAAGDGADSRTSVLDSIAMN